LSFEIVMSDQSKIANFFSKFFGPPITLPAMLVFLFWQTKAFEVGGNFVYLGILLVLCWLLPVLFFAFSLKKGWIDDIDATKKEQRYATYSLGGLGWLLGLWVSRLMVNSQFWRYYLGVLILILVLVLVTFFWKISVHAATVVFFYLLINYFYHWSFFWLLPVPVLVMWSRWYQKNHTTWQLVGGTMAAVIIFGVLAL